MPRSGKFYGMYKRGGHRVIINMRGDLAVRPLFIEASLQQVPGGKPPVSLVLMLCISLPAPGMQTFWALLRSSPEKCSLVFPSPYPLFFSKDLEISCWALLHGVCLATSPDLLPASQCWSQFCVTCVASLLRQA